jgi:hypothetical protein
LALGWSTSGTCCGIALPLVERAKQVPNTVLCFFGCHPRPFNNSNRGDYNVFFQHYPRGRVNQLGGGTKGRVYSAMNEFFLSVPTFTLVEA